MPNINSNSTNYFHSYEPNTNDLTMAMDYDGGGKPVLRTSGWGPSQVSAFGEPIAVEHKPIVQLDAIYGINDTLSYQTYSALGGTTTAQDSQYVVAASDTQYSYAVLRTRRFLRYRPGQDRADQNLIEPGRYADTTADITQLPTKYKADNTVEDNPNVGGLIQGRPWA